MYKLLLCLRYLRTRYIALASIVSVMLGVATMIVVNSVMAGFREEMYARMHGIMSDIVIESQALSGVSDPEAMQREVSEILGPDLEGITTTVHIPAMLNYQFRGEWITRQVNLIGIDRETYANVSDFGQYLLHPANRDQISFELQEGGYDAEGDPDANREQLRTAGWQHRRNRVAYERAYLEQMEALERQSQQTVAPPEMPRTLGGSEPLTEQQTPGNQEGHAESAIQFDPSLGPRPLPLNASNAATSETERSHRPPVAAPSDPFSGLAIDGPAEVFDEMRDQHTGVVLGISLASIRHRNPDGEVEDFFLCLPGDDVKLTFPTAGTPPQAVSDTFTVVDLYESKMVEHDSTFVFMPLERLQQLRGMIDPSTGKGAVTSIQIRLREDADLTAACAALRERFPAAEHPLQIHTWKELQGPLLAAVQLELTLLNILLFLIIAVAGFGILATFFMIVVEKTKDIGVLKSLGAPSRGVLSIFLTYGLSLGIVGSGVGTVLGLLFVANINGIARVVEKITGREVFDPTIYYFQEIPTIVSPVTITWIVCGAMLIAVLASVLPSLRAARLHPVEALRYE